MDNREFSTPELVQTFVGVSHGDLDKVKELLDQYLELVNAA